MEIRNMIDRKAQMERLDKILDRMNLQRKGKYDMRLPALGLFGLGLAVGAGLGVLFAPKSGEEIRSEAREKLPGMGGERRGQEEIYTRSGV